MIYRWDRQTRKTTHFFRDLDTGFYLRMRYADTETGLFEGLRATVLHNHDDGNKWYRWERFRGLLAFDVIDPTTRAVIDKARP